ncbi:MAG: pantoate--beta-alanine ligase [Vicinamibacteria bacterium]|nr:pantoate--beta-alanine ligase [Vicinamibacteria bacterium]
MQTLNGIAEVKSWLRSATGSLGLVPTMGALHEGHLSLIQRAKKENARVLATLFVNPRQFGPSEDLARYPRDLERDQRMLTDHGCDALFAPQTEVLYPAGCESYVDAGSVAVPLEGEKRPGHFRGVATVVLKLFNICEPTRAYFGQKDAQQLAVIRRMTRDLDVNVEIVPCPTVRESDGLALSSRNAYLAPHERRAATVLYRSLIATEDRFKTGERRADQLRRVMRQIVSAEPLAQLEYASIADPDTLQELLEVDRPALASLAVKIGSTRLIDNLLLAP